MPRFDLYKTLSQTGDSLRQLSVLNPLTIRQKGTKAKAVFALVLVCFLWGTTWLASKEGVTHMPSMQMASIRQLIAGSCYVVYFLSRGMKLPRGKEWIPVLVLSMLNFVLSNGLSTAGIKHISAGLGSIIGATFPLWLVVIGLFSAKNKIPTKAIVGLLLGFGGICLIFYEHLNDFLKPDFQLSIAMSLLATWTWAFATIYTKNQVLNFNPYFSLGLQMVISGTLLYSLSSFTGNSIPLSEIPWKAWASIGYLVLFGSLIAFIAYLYALQHLPTSQVSIYGYINPMVAVILGWLIFDEQITLFIVLGGLVTLLGVFIVNRAFKAIPPPTQPEVEGI